MIVYLVVPNILLGTVNNPFYLFGRKPFLLSVKQVSSLENIEFNNKE